jgi:Glycosyl transferase 4-like domain
MRILYICADTGIDVLGRKGASVHVREMIAAFTRAGHEVDLVAPRLVQPGAEPASTTATVYRARVSDEIQEAKAGIDAFMNARGSESSLGKDIRRMLYDADLNTELLGRYRDDPPDLIYVRSSLFSTAGVELAAVARCPLVVEVNSPARSGRWRRRLRASCSEPPTLCSWSPKHWSTTWLATVSIRIESLCHPMPSTRPDFAPTPSTPIVADRSGFPMVPSSGSPAACGHGTVRSRFRPSWPVWAIEASLRISSSPVTVRRARPSKPKPIGSAWRIALCCLAPSITTTWPM